MSPKAQTVDFLFTSFDSQLRLGRNRIDRLSPRSAKRTPLGLVITAGHRYLRRPRVARVGRISRTPRPSFRLIKLPRTDGVKPEISLQRARKKRFEMRCLLAEGIDPSAHRQ